MSNISTTQDRPSATTSKAKPVSPTLKPLAKETKSQEGLRSSSQGKMCLFEVRNTFDSVYLVACIPFCFFYFIHTKITYLFSSCLCLGGPKMISKSGSPHTMYYPTAIPIFYVKVLVQRVQALLKKLFLLRGKQYELTKAAQQFVFTMDEFSAAVKRCILLSNAESVDVSSPNDFVEALAWVMLLLQWCPFYNKNITILLPRTQDDQWDTIKGSDLQEQEDWCQSTTEIFGELADNPLFGGSFRALFTMSSLQALAFSQSVSVQKETAKALIAAMVEAQGVDFASEEGNKPVSTILGVLRESPQAKDTSQGFDLGTPVWPRNQDQVTSSLPAPIAQPEKAGGSTKKKQRWA